MSDQILPDGDHPSNPKPKRIRQQAAEPPADARPIPGHPGYLIDGECRIYSCWRGRVVAGTENKVRDIYQSETWYLLRPSKDARGFLVHRLRRESGRFASVMAHRVGLIAFVGPEPRRRAEAIHLDGNRGNNRIENLAWRERARPRGLVDRFEPAPSWRPIPGFPGYLASPEGRVYTLWSTRPTVVEGRRVREPFIKGECKLAKGKAEHLGYTSLELRRADGARVKVWTHRAILMAFRGLPGPGQEARHLDGNPANNHIDNLAWGTKAENAADKVRHGTAAIGRRHGMAKLTEDDVREIRLRKAAGDSSVTLALAFGVSSATIDGIVARRTWRHVD